MVITRTYKFKLYRNKKNKYLHNQIDLAGKIYNHCIALHKRYYRLYHKYLNRYKLNIHITKLKKLKKYKYWNELDAQAIQDITLRIDQSYQSFYRNLKKGIKTSPPGFKKVEKYKSFTLHQTGWKILEDNKAIVIDAVEAFAIASWQHKNDILNILEQIKRKCKP